MIDNKLTDEELIKALQDGDISAFDEIVDRFKRPLFSFIYRIVNDSGSAEDLVQETFFRLWTNRNSYRQIARFSTWLYTIAGNLAKSELRKKRLRRWLPIGGDASEGEKPVEIQDENADPERDFERRNIQSRVEEEIQKLPAAFREIIILRDIQELSYEEISTITKIPLGTVKSRINRARQRLQKQLDDLL